MVATVTFFVTGVPAGSSTITNKSVDTGAVSSVYAVILGILLVENVDYQVVCCNRCAVGVSKTCNRGDSYTS